MHAPAASTEAILAPSVRSGGLRDRLRTATAAAHTSLDATFSSFDLQTRRGYRRFLEASAAALLPVEAALADAGIAAILSDWRQRVRSGAIVADLAALGGVARPLPPLRRPTPAGALGALYVLEGSRLGARHLLKRVVASTDPAMAAATCYLRHGTGLPLWPRLLAVLDAAALTPSETDNAIGDALHVFALFAEGAHRS